MPSDVFEEPLELEIGMLEAGAPSPDSYPYPSLIPTGRSEKRTFRGVILENPYLRATFVPALGGRLYSLVDKRTGLEVLPAKASPVAGGRRGARLDSGLQLHLDAGERLTSLGAVQFAAEEPDEDRPAAVWLAESVTGTGLSWHLKATLPEDRAELIFEARVFNRSYREIPYSAGLLVPDLGGSRSDGNVFVTETSGNGLAFLPERGRWHAFSSEGSLVVSRFSQPRMLAARQLDSWTMSVIPFSGLRGISAASSHGALFVGDGVLQLQVASPLLEHKLVLLTATGKTLEAPVKVYPDKLLEMQLPEPVTAVALMDQAKNVLLKWEGALPAVGRRPDLSDQTDRPDQTDWTQRELEEATFDVATRHVAHSLLGTRALASGDLDEAEQRFEQALLYNAEDHLTWWMKGMVGRLRGEDMAEAQELPNAHYLAPLEPALRAESFLGSPATMEKEPSPLLAPLAEYPETFLEVAALLLQAGLYEQASRWIDEAIRHIDMPMLRYLLAYAHLRVTNMEFEAADHVAAAAKEPLAPPYPWRPIEIEAIDALVERFPNDKRLQEISRLTAGS